MREKCKGDKVLVTNMVLILRERERERETDRQTGRERQIDRHYNLLSVNFNIHWYNDTQIDLYRTFHVHLQI